MLPAAVFVPLNILIALALPERGVSHHHNYRWLMIGAEVFIFDEPTKGVDIGSKEEIYRLMTGLSRQGKGIIMISSDMPELLSMSDRIGVMRGGELVNIVPTKEASEERLIKEYLGF